LIDGELAVFSTEKDKVKLEAITMVIWGCNGPPKYDEDDCQLFVA